jgi:hypothetical protein
MQGGALLPGSRPGAFRDRRVRGDRSPPAAWGRVRVDQHQFGGYLAVELSYLEIGWHCGR